MCLRKHQNGLTCPGLKPEERRPVFIAMKRHYDHGDSYLKKIIIKHVIWVAFSFKDFVYCHPGGTWQPTGRHGIGDELRVLCLDSQVTGIELCHRA